jgi:hypothetical protein
LNRTLLWLWCGGRGLTLRGCGLGRRHGSVRVNPQLTLQLATAALIFFSAFALVAKIRGLFSLKGATRERAIYGREPAD